MTSGTPEVSTQREICAARSRSDSQATDPLARQLEIKVDGSRASRKVAVEASDNADTTIAEVPVVGNRHSIFVPRGWPVLPFPQHVRSSVCLALVDDGGVWREQRE